MKAEDFYEEMGGDAQYCEWDLGDAHHSKQDMVEFANDFAQQQRQELIKELQEKFSDEELYWMFTEDKANEERSIYEKAQEDGALTIRDEIINHLKQKQ